MGTALDALHKRECPEPIGLLLQADDTTLCIGCTAPAAA